MQEPIPPRSHTSGWRRAWRGLWVTLTAKPTWTQAPRRDSGPVPTRQPMCDRPQRGPHTVAAHGWACWWHWVR